jgi:hypothetical protein
VRAIRWRRGRRKARGVDGGVGDLKEIPGVRWRERAGGVGDGVYQKLTAHALADAAAAGPHLERGDRSEVAAGTIASENDARVAAGVACNLLRDDEAVD